MLLTSRIKPSRSLLFLLGLLIVSIILFRRLPLYSDPNRIPIPNTQDTSKPRYKIGKASMLYGTPNGYFEKALESHSTHNEVHGYPMHILTNELTKSYWNKLLYIQSIIVGELAKPTEERLDWIWWVDPSIILLNPSIPLDMFLPPDEPQFAQVSFLGTHVNGELDTSTFFIKVSPWSIRFLTKAMALPLYDAPTQLSSMSEVNAMGTVIVEPDFKGSVIYQPLKWYNSAIGDDLRFSNTGNLLLAFPDSLGDNRWRAMSDVLDVITPEGNKAKLPFPVEYTYYPNDIARFWDSIVEGRSKLADAEWAISKLGEKHAPEELKKAVAKMKEVIVLETDNNSRMREAVERIKWHLNLVKVPK